MLENVSSRKGLSLIVIMAVSIALAIYFVQGITSNTSATNKVILNLASDTNLDVDAVFTSDGNTALLPTTSHLSIIDIASGNIIKLINLASDTMPGVDVVFTADDMIAVLPTTSHLYMIEIPSGGIKEVINLASDTNTDVDVVITPDGNTALLPTTSHLYIIDIQSGNIKALINLASNTQKCVDVMITPDGNTALLPTTSHLYIIDIPSGNVRELLNLASDTNLEVDLRITPDGNTALLPTTSHLYIIDVSSGNIQALLNLASNTMPGVDIVITPEGNTALLPTILHLHVIDVSSGNIKTLLILASNTMPGVDIVVTPEGNTALLPTTSHLHMIDVSSGNIKTLLNLASNTMKGVDIVVTPEGNTAFLPTTSHLYMIDVSSGNIKTLLNLASDTNLDIDLEVVCPIISGLPGSIGILPTRSHLYIIDGLPQDNVLLPTISHLYMLNGQSCNTKELLNLASDTMRGVDVVIARNILTADPDEDFPVLPTPLDHREKLIFSIDAGELEKDLDEGSVPERLKEKFEAKNIPLSEDVIVEKSGDVEWTITDKEKVYIARKKEGMIDVYTYTPTEPVKSIVSRSDNFNHIKIQTELQKVLIGQNLQFEGFDETVTVSRIVSGDVENVYQADANNCIYNVNWPTSGVFYVNYQEPDQAQLSVEKSDMPLELKVGTKKVSFIAVGTDITIDTGGMSLFPEDQVDLVVIGPHGQIKYDEVNNQRFTDITVAELVSNFGGRPNSLETSRWAIGDYTFRIETDSENACGLEAKSAVKELKILNGGIEIEAEPTSTIELDTVTVTVTGVAGDEIEVVADPCKDAVFIDGVDDTPTSGCSFTDTIDSDGIRKYAIEFSDTGTYTLRATVLTSEGGLRDGSYDTVDITVLEKDVTFYLPDEVVIGEKLDIQGTATSGTYVSVYVDDVLYDQLTNILMEDGEFTKEVTTTEVGMNLPGSVKLKAWIDCDKAAGEYPPSRCPDGEDAILLSKPILSAELSVPSVALEDDFAVFGIAHGQFEVVILSVPPKGGGGKSLLDKGDKGLSPRKASVSMTDDTYSKKMPVHEDATAGYYDVYVLCAGMDGVWGMTGQKDLEEALNQKFHISSLTCVEGSAICTKTQEEIEDILEDLVTTEGSDDLMVKLRLKVETPYVFLHPVPDVKAPAPLVAKGTSNRKDGYTIVVTCISATTELEPQTVYVENGTFSATFDTRDAVTGTYVVKADDGDGHVAEQETFITGTGISVVDLSTDKNQYSQDETVSLNISILNKGTTKAVGLSMTLRDADTGDELATVDVGSMGLAGGTTTSAAYSIDLMDLPQITGDSLEGELIARDLNNDGILASASVFICITSVTPPTPTEPMIAFRSDRDGNPEIYVMDADGSNQKRLTNNSVYDIHPTWSPDGKRIAFASNREGVLKIYVMNADGSGLKRLTNNSATYYYPAWSPDGKRIAFVNGNWEICVMNVDGSNQRCLTDNPSEDNNPTWSPDGKYIAFYSLRDGRAQIYVMDADGSNQRRLSNMSGSCHNPAWSPDGRLIAFRSGGICVMNADGSNPIRLTNTSDEEPAWSSDGRHIVFVSRRDSTPYHSNPEIYVMNADGSDQRNLTNNPANDADPAWSPTMPVP